MYETFKNERVALSLVKLDKNNPRIITQATLSSEEKIIDYLFQFEGLSSFLKLIAAEGRNPAAERPYVVKTGKTYCVVEGNTRIAAYKLLSGEINPPEAYKSEVPHVPQSMKSELSQVDVVIAPSRDALMVIMARSHFGRGDKARWRYLGNRKAVFSDYTSGKSIAHLANIFERTQSQIRDYILEYLLYVEALKLDWTASERELLLRPTLEFNPPVRFLQSTGHKQLVGIELDKANLLINFVSDDSRKKLKHLIKRTVLEEGGPSAIASYSEVFADFNQAVAGQGSPKSNEEGKQEPNTKSQPKASENDEKKSSKTDKATLKPFALFNYAVTKNDLTLSQLMKEAKGLNTKQYPGAGTALLRGILEVLLKLIVEEKKINPQGKLHDVESALNLVVGQAKMSADDTNILKEFRAQHVKYINLSTHATVVPNYDRLVMARDCIDAFVKRNV